jgi:tetrapyrrole methylase family protein/MazG family protein
MARPRIDVVGLGPGGPDLLTAGTLAIIERHSRRYLRTVRHPAAAVVTGAVSFDEIYSSADTLDAVYPAIVDRLVRAALSSGDLLYAVPGSPLVAERTVVLLREVADVEVVVHPAMSYLDVAWAALGVDPMARSVRLVDGHRFAVDAAGERGPLLVAQCDSVGVLSDVKLAVPDGAEPERAIILWHLGLPEQRIIEVAWSELDHFADADHLTSVWIEHLATPVGAELIRFYELVRTLREQCPWDREQTHLSLTRHLLEETYEALEAIEAFDPSTGEGAEHLSEELGDVLFQVYFHAVLGAEAGWFTIADVAQGVHDKLVTRHPHVFGEVVAESSDAVLANWEQIKQQEKGRASIMDGIPGNLPALAHAVKVQRKAASVGFDWPDVAGPMAKIHEELDELIESAGNDRHQREELGDLLFAIGNVARHLDIDPEAALRAASAKFQHRFRLVEGFATDDGADLRHLSLNDLDRYWDRAKSTER